MIPFLIPSLIAGGSTLLSGLFQGSAQRRAARQQAAAMQPYADAGADALSQMRILMGMGSPEDQAAAIAAIEGSPEMAAMVAQGENAILSNASATGGLRGGNTQGALAQFRPQVLSQLINQRMTQLGGLASMGYNAAGKVGEARAAGALGAGSMWNAIPNALTAGMGMYTGLGGSFGVGAPVELPLATPNMPQVGYPAGGRNAAGW